MAESYSVKAILSATDSGFSSTLKGASSAVESFASKVKSGFTFGLLTGAGQAFGWEQVPFAFSFSRQSFLPCFL